jgi:predicted O-methyltransferase YrrM
MIGLKDPSNALTYILKGKDEVIKNKLCEITSRSYSDIDKFYKNIKNSNIISDEFNSKKIGQIGHPEWMYTICRIVKPTVVVETGVASGVSSAYILKALADNNHGNLISIDMPNYEKKLTLAHPEYSNIKANAIVRENETGWLVPENLRNRWTLKLGLVQELLVPTLEESGQIDLFFHDSEHTYNNMMFEFRNAWRFLRSDGLLLSHDITWNNSFADFAKEVKRNFIHIYFTSAGAIIK